MRKTNIDLKQSEEQYGACPSSRKEYVIDGRKYMVTRHFTGEKDINEWIIELAIDRANREMGL